MPAIDYAAVFATLPLPAILIDAQGTVVDVNDAYLASMGKGPEFGSREILIGQPIWEFAPSDDPLLRQDRVLEFLQKGNPPAVLERIEATAAGDAILHEIRALVLPEQSGAIIVREEITERVRQAERLQESSRYLQAFASVGRIVLESLDLQEILDSMPRELVRAGVFRSLMLALVDEDQTYVEVQRSFVREVDEGGHIIPGSAIRPSSNISGRRFKLNEDNPTPIVARTGKMQILVGEEPRLAPPYRGVLAMAGTRPRVSFFFPVKSGDRVIAVLATAASDDERDVILARIEAMQPLLDHVAIAIEHARMYEKIRTSEASARVRLGVERIRNAILQMESDRDWIHVVQTLTDELVGLVDDAASGINLVREGGVVAAFSVGRGTSDTWEEPGIPDPVAQALATGEAVYRRNPQQMRRSGDTQEMIDDGIRSVIDLPFGTGTLALNSPREDAFSASIIENLWLFAAIIGEGHRRLEDLRALDVKERQLQQAQKMEAVGQLTAGIAHNFNNLLQAMMGELDLAMLETDQQEANELISGALSAAQRASHLVHQLLVYARQSQPGELSSTDPLRIVAEVEAICRRTFDRRLELDIDNRIDADVRVVADPMQLEHVFLNLCINARDALEEAKPTQPRIEIVVEGVELNDAETPDGIGGGSFLRVIVSDNGPGMDETVRRRIFDPFFTTKAVDRGTGLGLSTAQAIMQDHGGWLRCDSETDKGTHFSAMLPMTVAQRSQPMTPAPPVELLGGDETVLIIDDEEMVRSTAARMLRRRGYTVLEAEDGESGLQVYRENREQVRLVLLDHSMPRMSGREVLAQLRSEQSTVRIVIITGIPAGLDDFEGADELMEKPFSLQTLVGRVREILDSV
ncbi:MAG: response regulator [Gemmatimonadetes bacterium]|nr:response regulator [Gemmatimonadota bacterium]